MPEVRKLQSVDEVAALLESSHQKPVLIFKHSLICPISTMAYREFESHLSERPEGDDVAYTLVEIQKARPVSNEIAQQTGVRHESPQALLVRDGKVVWHKSHSEIRRTTLDQAVAG